MRSEGFAHRNLQVAWGVLTHDLWVLAEKLRASGVPVTLKVYARTNHYTLIGAFARPLRGLAPVLQDVVEFVRGTPGA